MTSRSLCNSLTFEPKGENLMKVIIIGGVAGGAVVCGASAQVE